jgi:zinc protease
MVRETIPDQVELTKLVMAFHSPARYAPGDAELDLLAAVLATGKSSRLYRALVLDRQLAQSVSAWQSSMSLSSLFTLDVVLRSGVAPEAAEAAIDAVLAEIAVDGPSQEELDRARNGIESRFVGRLQSIAERAMALNLYHAEVGVADWAERDLERYRGVTTARVRDQALRTLDLHARGILRVVPASAPPAPAAPPEPAHEESR